MSTRARATSALGRGGRAAVALGRSVARRAKAKIGPGFGAESTADPAAPRFVFNPAMDRWSVEHHGRTYTPATSSDLDALLTLLPVEVDDRPSASRLGTVRVTDAGGRAELEFSDSRESGLTQVLARLRSHRQPAHHWVEGAHDDGWIDTHARLRIDRPGLVTVTAYLPPGEGAPKDVAVQVGLGRAVKIEVFRLERGATTQLQVRSDDAAPETVLTFQTSHPEPGADERLLGFVVTGIHVAP